MTWEFKHFHMKVIQYTLLINMIYESWWKKKIHFSLWRYSQIQFLHHPTCLKVYTCFLWKNEWSILINSFCAWGYKGHSLFDWGWIQHCGQCCCLHVIFNLLTECTHLFLVIRVCTALLQFRVSIKFRNMSSFSPVIFQKI